MRVVIIGGGFIGQLLHLFWPKARVFDWRPKAPERSTRSLGPQYLWEPIPELTCRPFEVVTTVDWQEPTDERILAYKKKVGKDQDNGDWRSQFRPLMTGYDCILPEPRVEYGKRIVSVQVEQYRLIMADGSAERYDLLLSTIPLNALLQLCGRGWEAKTFVQRPIYMHCDALHLGLESEWARLMDDRMHVNYVSQPHLNLYRQTARDGWMYTESLDPFGSSMLGTVVKILPGKIYPNAHLDDHTERLTRNNIKCFGRFASWSPDELAHETIQKVRHYKESQGL